MGVFFILVLTGSSRRCRVNRLFERRCRCDSKGGCLLYCSEVDIGRKDNAFVIGDASGLATRDLCEGIGPAVQSGLLAARSIATGASYSLDSVKRYSGANRWMRQGLAYLMQRRT